MTNFVFLRRDLQPCIDRLAAVIEPAQLEKIVAGLNRKDKNRLPTMWELVVLDALSQVAGLQHEVPLPSGRKPDFQLSTSLPSGAPLLIVGDIACVSDSGLDAQNPVDVFFSEGARIAKRVGLNPNHMHYSVEADRTGEYGDERITLQLPPKGKLMELLNGPVKQWMVSLKTQSLTADTYECVDEGYKFILKYDQAQRYQSGSYASYDVAASLERNPLFKALKSKRDQLDGAPDGSLRLIVGCDGDSALLNRSDFTAGYGQFSAKQVANHFLTKFSTVDAILLCTVEQSQRTFTNNYTYILRFHLEVAEKVATVAAMSEAIRAMSKLLDKAASLFPTPWQMPVNAAMRCKDSEVSNNQNGAYQMNGNSFSVSARGLLDLLAGKITSEQYHAEQPWGEKRFGNIFQIKHDEGRSFQSARIEPMEGTDDDWITFEFGEPDPAAAPFATPHTNPVEPYGDPPG